MLKREDVKVFMLCHKAVDYGFIDDEVVTPLECGAAVCDNDVCETKDNTGDNISDWNEFFTEDTGIYWIWKNVHAKYKGQTQYRRILSGVSNLDYDKIFSEYKAIIAKPMNLAELYYIPELTLEKQYLIAHDIEDLLIMEEIIKEKFPEYAESYDKYVKNGTEILYSNGFVMPEEEYNKYCEQLFEILDEWLYRNNIYTVEDVKRRVYEHIMFGKISNATMDNWHRMDIDYCVKYQSRIGGSLAERFFTMYAFHNFGDKIYFVDYDKPEGNKL